jgi:hypothetical protein
MQILKQSTGTSIQVGPFLDDTDGKTPETSLSVGEVSAAGGSANFCKLQQGGVSVNVSPGDWAHIGNGYYALEIAGASLALAGNARIFFASATPDFRPIFEDLFIMHATIYDIFTAGAWSGVSIGGVSKVTGITQSGVSNIFDGVIDLSGASVFSLKECVKIQNAALFGKASGGGGTTTAFRDLADGKNRIDAVVDAVGNRTTVSWDGT